MRSWYRASTVAIALVCMSCWACGTEPVADGSDGTVGADVAGGLTDVGGAGVDAVTTIDTDEDVVSGDGLDAGQPGQDGDTTAATEDTSLVDVPPEPTCLDDSDCAHLAGGMGPCRIPRCQDEVCVGEGLPDGTACDDEDPCTVDDACLGSTCGGDTIVGCASDEVAESTIVIHEVHFDGPDSTVRSEFVELFNHGVEPVDLSGWLLEDGVHFSFPAGTILESGQYLVVAEDPETLLAVYGAESIGPYANTLASDGERLVLRDATGERADEVDFSVGYPWPVAGGGSGASMELIYPGLDNDLAGSWRSSAVAGPDGLRVPTPGGANSVADINAPPQSRQVTHLPQAPTTEDAVVIAVKVTDPQGVAAVTLQYQVVAPGAYLPSAFPVPFNTLQDAPETAMAVNPAYADAVNWVTVTLNDDGLDGDAFAGDDRYAVTLPAQGNRTLVRYRIGVEDLTGVSVTVPYDDDKTLNFAYYVYDGVPDYGEHSTEVLESVPVYTIIARPEDVTQVMAYSGNQQFPQQYQGSVNEARSVYNWPVTLVYDGVVYDHIRFRLRGSYGRYQLDGKRSFRFRFNRGRFMQARDGLGEPYPTRWRTLTTGKGFENRQTLTYDVNCVVNNTLMRSVGVPAPHWHWFHLRVVDGVDEAPDPWTGDFWGLHSATETYDKRFFESHGLEKGNLYKLVYGKYSGVDQRRYQAPNAVSNGADHDNIEQNVTGYSSASFIRAHVNLPEWYAYHGLAEAVRHYDFWPNGNKNQVYYFSPDYEPANSGYGRLWVLPWDSDSSWGPTWFNGHDVVYNALYNASGQGSDNASTPELQLEYQNVIREIRDLLWQPDQIEPLIDRVASPIAAFIAPDWERWNGGPSSAGSYNGLGGAGSISLAAYLEDMKAFAFVGGDWPGGGSAGSPGGGPIGPGGRAAHLDALQSASGEGDKIPNTPVVTYLGAPEYPVDGLSFETDLVADPQGAESVTTIAWRLARDGGPDLDPTVPLHLEMFARWESGPLTGNPGAVTVPLGAAVPGETYRLRARALDSTGRWSHWSAPVVFTAGAAQDGTSALAALRLTEIMYNPPLPAASSPYTASAYEFLEFHNAGEAPLQLGGVAIQGGVSMTFPIGMTVDPGGYLVVARDTEAFAERYGAGFVVAGEYDGKLSNGGESVSLVANGEIVSTWTYDDQGAWPRRADGMGSSLEAPDATADPALPSSWRASSELYGNPGWQGIGPSPTPVINEVVAWWGGTGTWQVELYNPTDEDIDVGGWSLGVAPDYEGVVIADDVIVPAGGYLLVGDNDVVTLPLFEGRGELWLTEFGFIARIHDQVGHDAWSDGEAWGRWPDGTGPMVPMTAPTLASANAEPRIGPLLISEFMAQAAELPEGADPDDFEYIEVLNPTGEAVVLGGWELTGGVDMAFPAGQWLEAGDTLLVLPWNPASPGNAERLTHFLEHYGLTDDTPLVGGYDGTLSDLGETVSLWRANDGGVLSLEDTGAYGDAWTVPGDVLVPGDALHRQGPQSLGMASDSWLVGAPTPGVGPTW